MRITLPVALVILSAVFTAFCTIYFASLRPEYSHFRHTISELGESGAIHQNPVQFLFFFPVGLLIWLAVWLAMNHYPNRLSGLTLILFSCLGTGYVMSAIFPADTGSPMWGSWQQQLHNLFGLIEYAGTAAGIVLAANSLKSSNKWLGFYLTIATASLIVISLLLLSLPPAFAVRGLIQRLCELTMFITVAGLLYYSTHTE